MIDATEFGSTVQTYLSSFPEPVRSAEFKIFSGLLKTHRGEDGKLRFRATASSTTRDLHGDVMERTALEDMLAAANNNLTIFLNHSYNVPEDVAGSVERASMQPRGADGSGVPIWDLDFDVIVNDANPRAVDAFNAIEKGTKLGLSIGAMIPEGGATYDKAAGAFTIHHVELLETSIVGIPANPRSWVQSATKALKAAQPQEMTVIVGGNTTTTVTVEELKEAPPADPSICGEHNEDGSIACTADPGHEGDHTWSVDSLDSTPEPEAPDGSDAEGDGSQEASDSDPETEPADVVTDAVSAEVLAAMAPDLVARLETAVNEIVDLRRQLANAEQAREDAVRERDEAMAVTVEVLAKASRVIEQLAEVPIGRKSVVRNISTEFSALESVYGPKMLKLMRGSNE